MEETTSQGSDSAQNQPVILLDNHMIQYFLSKDTAPHLAGILQEVVESNIQLGVSQIVVYEALKAIIFKDDKFEKVKNFLETYPIRYPVSEEILVEAARVHELYGSDDNTRNRRSGISTEDIIIATTSMLLGAYVMTCDANDFPLPFFKEINRQYIYYEASGQRRHIILYLLQPDTEAIEAALQLLNPVKPKHANRTKKTVAKAKKQSAK